VASADVLLSLPGSDSTPASLLEAMASGLPAVCGIAPSIDEWVEQGQGAELVPGRDVDAVAAALGRLLGDPALRRRYGERNERVVRERIADPGQALEELYRELVPA
jgi:glycosyltransferase involved in cell wall biosynthesis